MHTIPVSLSIRIGNILKKLCLPVGLASFVLFAMVFSRPASAQGIQQFVGHIADSTGAAIPGANVTIHNEGTGVDLVVNSTEAGDYTAPYMKPGTYTITAALTGFKEVSKTHISLDIDQTSKMDFVLPVGNMSESVTVSSEGSQIELAKADRGEIIDAERVQEMPLDGRNAIDLFTLSPGTINAGNPVNNRQQDNVNQNLDANGVTINAVAENIDGATNDNAGNYMGYNPPLDSISEFKVVLNPYDASYGRAGGASIDISLKSGSNKFHGDIYEFARRPYLEANTWVNDFSHVTKAKHKRDQFGAELDGPVIIPHFYNGKDKTFFLLQWEQAYEALPNTSPTISSIPNPAWTNGNFAGAQYFDSVTQTLMPLNIYDPLSAQTPYTDPADGKKKVQYQQFPGNIIPGSASCSATTSCINPIGHALAQYYNGITPNYNPGAGYAPYSNNLYWVQVENDISRNGTIKIDQNFGRSDRATIRWGGFERFANQNQNGIPASDPANSITTQFQPVEQQYSIEEIHTFSANLILDNKAILSTYKQGLQYGTRGDYLNQLGFSSNFISNAYISNMIPYVSATSNLGAKDFIPLSWTSPGRRNVAHNLSYEPSATYIHGRHTLRAGLDMRLLQYAPTIGPNNSQTAGNVQFNFSTVFSQQYTPAYANAPGLTSGSSIASLLEGYPVTGNDTGELSSFYSQHYEGIWAQDDWKVTPKLTLNIGLRYDLLGARTERHNKLAGQFNSTASTGIASGLGPIVGGLTGAGTYGTPRGAYGTHLLNIQPRFGAAYAFTSRTSLRMGFGEMFANDESLNGNNGFAVATNFSPSTNGNLTPTTGQFSNPFPTFVQPFNSNTTSASSFALSGVGNSISFVNPNYNAPSIWQYSVSLEQLLTRRDVIDISYSGTRGYGLPGSDDINHVSAAWYAQCDIERGGNRQLCDATSGAAKVTNPFQNLPAFAGTGTYSTASTLSSSILTRPFPQFTSITENNLPLVRSWYNSMQVTASHNASRDLSMHLAYTWAKGMQAGNIIDTVNRVYGRNISSNDVTTTLSLSGVYYLPVGRGKTFLGHSNRLVDAAVGGWEFSPLYTYTGGFPWSPDSGTTNNFEQVSSLGIHQHDLQPDSSHAYKRLQGVNPCVGYQDSDTPGLIHPGPAYVAAGCTTYAIVRQENNPSGSFASDYSVGQNIVYTGVREVGQHQFDVSASKRFAWNEKANLQLRLDAINVLNHPNFTGYKESYTNDPTNLNWGTIQKGPTGPSNGGRELQLSGKVTF